MTRVMTYLCAAAITLGAASGVKAATVSLGDLIDDPAASLTVGDKRFDQFSYTAGGEMPAAENVTVSTFTDAGGNFGLLFNGAFVDGVGGEASDAVIRYRVSVTDPQAVITGANLTANFEVDADNGAFGSIIESFLTQSQKFLEVYSGDGGTVEEDSTEFEQSFTALYVQKDILLHGREDGEGAAVDEITQTFTQGPDGGGEPIPIPEPAAISMLALAAAGLMARRR